MGKKDLVIVGVIIGALVVAALWGYSRGRTSTAQKYEAQISELKSDWQKQTEAVEKEAQERYEKQSRRMAVALAARDKVLSDARAVRVTSVRVTSVRVRDAAGTRAKSDLQIARDTGDRTQERLARCESLLGEGAELAGEGAELLTRVAADKETMRATCVAGDMANFVGGSEIIGN